MGIEVYKKRATTHFYEYGSTLRFFNIFSNLPAFIKQGGAIYVTVEERDDKKLLDGKNIIVTGGGGILC